MAFSWLRFGWLIAALLAFAIYLPALGYDFTFDDDVIIKGNWRIERLDRPGAYLATSWWNVFGQTKEYRPATMASFALNYAVHERRPFGYHLVNNLMHALNAALVWFIARAIARSMPYANLLALLSGILFAIHPIHIEAVAGIVGRAELQMSGGYLFGLFAAMKSRDAGSSTSRRWWTAAVLPAALLATFSKEQGVTLPVVIALLALTDSKRNLRQALVALLPCIIVAACADVAYFGVRRAVIGAFLTPDKNVTSMGANPLVLLTPFKARLAAVALFSLISKSLVFPWPQSPDYSFAVFNPFELTESYLFPLGFVLLALAAIGAAFYRRQYVCRFGLILMLASLAVASNLIITIGTIFGERLLYLPSVGFALFVAGILFDSRLKPRLRKTAILAFGVWSLALLAMHFSYLPNWRKTENLMQYAVGRVPRSANAQQAWALDLRERGKLEEALHHMRLAAEIDPNHYYRALRAVILIELGRPEGTLADLEQGHALKPENIAINRHLAQQLSERGQLDRAERVLIEGLYANNEKGESVKMLEDWRAKYRQSAQP